MANPIAPLLAEKGYVLLDGALATELERRGHDLEDPLWSAKVLLEAPEALEAVCRDYLSAGADIATSASYQASFEGFAARGLSEDETVRIMKRSVEIAKAACRHHGRGLAVASVGCFGAYLHDGSEYRGDYALSAKELKDFHRRRLEALNAAAPDLFAFETIPSLLEAEVLTGLAEELDLGCWLSFSCRNGSDVSHGEAFADAVAVVSRSPAVLSVGVNCTPPQLMTPLLRSARGAADKPFIVYPNSGESWDGRRHAWEGAPSAFDLADHAAEWRRLGAKLIGGCCRTTPETIRQIRAALDQPSTL